MYGRSEADKNSQQEVEEVHFELICETFEKKQPKQRLTEVWSDAQQTVVDEAIDEW